MAQASNTPRKDLPIPPWLPSMWNPATSDSAVSLTRTTTTPLPIREVGVVEMGISAGHLLHLLHLPHPTFQSGEDVRSRSDRRGCRPPRKGGLCRCCRALSL